MTFVSIPAAISAPATSASRSVAPRLHARAMHRNSAAESANSSASGFTPPETNPSIGVNATPRPPTVHAQRRPGRHSRTNRKHSSAVTPASEADSNRISVSRSSSESWLRHAVRDRLERVVERRLGLPFAAGVGGAAQERLPFVGGQLRLLQRRPRRGVQRARERRAEAGVRHRHLLLRREHDRARLGRRAPGLAERLDVGDMRHLVGHLEHGGDEGPGRGVERCDRGDRERRAPARAVTHKRARDDDARERERGGAQREHQPGSAAGGQVAPPTPHARRDRAGEVPPRAPARQQVVDQHRRFSGVPADLEAAVLGRRRPRVEHGLALRRDADFDPGAVGAGRRDRRLNVAAARVGNRLDALDRRPVLPDGDERAPARHRRYPQRDRARRHQLPPLARGRSGRHDRGALAPDAVGPSAALLRVQERVRQQGADRQQCEHCARERPPIPPSPSLLDADVGPLPPSRQSLQPSHRLAALVEQRHRPRSISPYNGSATTITRRTLYPRF